MTDNAMTNNTTADTVNAIIKRLVQIADTGTDDPT